MKEKHVILFILSIMFFNCKNIEFRKNTDYEVINIGNSKIDSVKDLTGYVKDIKIIPLIQRSGFHFANVFKFLTYHSSFILYDRFNSNRVLLFDSTGNFEKVVCKVGNGLNDPLNINDIWLNNKGNLEVYDFGQMKILEFDSSLNFTNSVKSVFLNHYISISPIPSTTDYVGYTNFNYFNRDIDNKQYEIAFLDTSLNPIGGAIAFKERYQGIPWPTYNQHFFRYEDSLFFLKAFDNRVYKIKGTNLTVRYKVKYEIDNPEENSVFDIVDRYIGTFKNRKTSPLIRNKLLKRYTYLKNPWIESRNIIVINSLDTLGIFGSYLTTFYDKKERKELFSFRKMVETKRFKMEIPSFQYFDEKDGEYISVISGESLKALLFDGSLFQKVLTEDPYDFYVVMIKLWL